MELSTERGREWARPVSSRRSPWSVHRGRAAVCASLLAVLALSCARRRPTVFRGAPLVFISIDTLRADRLPAYGYTKVETPAIDAFRKDAILFENAYTHVPLTLPSHVSIFTGRLPGENGVHDNQGYVFEKSIPTLPALLKDAGYDTGGAVSAIVLTGSSGISRGFDFFDDAVEPTKPNQVLGRVQRAGDETAASLEKWIGGREGRPFFAFFHTYEPHTPYEPPEPFRSRYADPYDGEVAAADAVVGRFLEFLKARNLYERSVIVLFSDHGEGLGDHGEDEHGLFLYREVLRVPLMLKLPGSSRGGETVTSVAALTDIFPTALSALGREVALPAGPRSLLELSDQAGKTPARTVFSETFFPRLHFGWSDLASLVDLDSHYIEGPRPEFFDLQSDPRETANIIEKKTPAFRALRLEMSKRDRRFARPGAVDAEHAAKLASLGYVSAGGRSEGPLPDPKDRVGLVKDIKLAFGFFTNDRNEEAARAFEKLLAESPAMLDIWEAYSEVLIRLGRDQEALVALKRGIELSPTGAPGLLISVARLDLKTGRLDEALKYAQLAREQGEPTADDVLAQIYLEKRDLGKAESFARSALARAPGKRLPHVILAKAEKARGNLAGALAQLDEALRKTRELRLPQMSGLQLLRGDILGRLERPREAEEAFKAEIAFFPENGEACGGLALLYGSEGRIADARRTLDLFLKDGSPATAYLASARVLTIIGDPEGAGLVIGRGRARYPNDSRFSRSGK